MPCGVGQTPPAKRGGAALPVSQRTCRAGSEKPPTRRECGQGPKPPSLVGRGRHTVTAAHRRGRARKRAASARGPRRARSLFVRNVPVQASGAKWAQRISKTAGWARAKGPFADSKHRSKKYKVPGRPHAALERGDEWASIRPIAEHAPHCTGWAYGQAEAARNMSPATPKQRRGPQRPRQGRDTRLESGLEPSQSLR